MDDFTALRCRNAVLETELRLIKEQLAQAHGATNYLVTTFSSQQAQHERTAIDRLQMQLDETTAENAQLRHRLRITQSHTVGNDAAWQPAVTSGVTAQQLPFRQSALPESPGFTLSGVGQSDDLMSFEDGEGWSTPRGRASPSPLQGTSAKTSRIDSPMLYDHSPVLDQRFLKRKAPTTEHDGIGLGITGLDHSQRSTIIAPAQQTTIEQQQDRNVRIITHADGSTSTVMLTPESLPPSPVLTASAVTAASPPPLNAPSGPRWQFGHWERCFLLDRACFIEDLDEDEYAARWVGIAKTKPRHTAEEWREYYETVIRPAYQAREAAKAAAEEVEACSEDVKKVTESDAGGMIPDGHRVAVAIGHSVVASDNSELADQGLADQEQAEDALIVRNAFDNQSQTIEMESAIDSTALRTNEQQIDTADSIAEPEPKAEIASSPGMMASRWAPKQTVADVPVTATVSAEARPLPAVSVDAVPTFDQMCAEELEAAWKAPEQQQLGEYETSTLDADITPLPADTVVRSSPNAGIHRVERPTGRFGGGGKYNGDAGGRPVRNGGFVDTRPRCCHCPSNNHELLHSSFEHDASTLRTVMISNIPMNVLLTDVLNGVRGGKILGATYLELSKMKTKPAMETNRVMVTFLYANEAKKYAEVCEKLQRLFYWSEEWEAPFKATVTHLQTPVRPPNSGPSIECIRQQGMTRVIYVQDDGTKTADFVVDSVNGVFAKQNKVCKYPLCTGRDKDGMLFLEFASIGDAVMVNRAMESLAWEIGSMAKGFLPDPCEQPLRGQVKEINNDAVVKSQAGDARMVVEAEAEYTVAREQVEDDAPPLSKGSRHSEAMPISQSAVEGTDSTPRVGWGTASSLEEARKFLSSATRSQARGRKAAPRGEAHARYASEEDEMLREGEAIGAEG